MRDQIRAARDLLLGVSREADDDLDPRVTDAMNVLTGLLGERDTWIGFVRDCWGNWGVLDARGVVHSGGAPFDGGAVVYAPADEVPEHIVIGMAVPYLTAIADCDARRFTTSEADPGEAWTALEMAGSNAEDPRVLAWLCTAWHGDELPGIVTVTCLPQKA